MKVLQLLPELNEGGVERGVVEFNREFVRAGVESWVASNGGRLVSQIENDGGQHFTLDLCSKNPFTAPYRIVQLQRLFQQQQPDIIHARSRVPAWLAWLANKPLDIPFVTTVHGMHRVNRYSRIMSRGNRVIAVSKTVEHYLVNNYPNVDPSHIHVIPRGVTTSEFPYGFRPQDAWLAKWQNQFPQLSNKRVLTLAGRITRLKGHHALIDLIANLKHRGIELHGLIVGSEDKRRRAYAAELRERIKREGLDADITFTGHRADMREIFAISDLVLSLSSRPESFGRTVLEALSLGRPVLGYAHGGVGEILEELYPAGRVPLGDQTELIDKAWQLLTDPPPVAQTHSFSLASMVDKTLQVYHDLLAHSAPSSSRIK